MWRYYRLRKRLYVMRISLRRDMNHVECAYCSCRYTPTGKRRRTVDHVIALANGGKNRPSNMVFACNACNMRKGTMSLDDFLASPWLVRRKAVVFTELLSAVT